MLVAATQGCAFGDPADSSTVCGPMISEAEATRVHHWIQEAVEGGASVLVGGTRNGTLVAPTLVENAPPASKLMTEEVFGPVATLQGFNNWNQAFAKVNASQFGIHTGVFTQSDMIGQRAYEGLEVGGVVLNDVPTVRFDALPYGGTRESGFGREGVRFAIQEMTEPRSFVKALRTTRP